MCGANRDDRHVVMLQDRIVLCRHKESGDWMVESNPTWCSDRAAADMILMNAANKYVEKENCGVLYRMIRLQDAESYGISVMKIKIGSVLRCGEGAASIQARSL